MLLAAFMFPAALMFLVTGGFYTWGISGSYESHDYVVELDRPLTADTDTLAAIAERELQRLDIKLPTGQAKVKTIGTSFHLDWTGSKRDVLLEPTANPLEAKLVVKETTWYRNLVQLHKAKGGMLFKIYATMLAVALFFILASGFLMAWQLPKYRRLAGVTAAAGTLLFFIVLALS